ncbi:hypothetical protein RD792_007439 [Penstemon davidsonii]|uniref:HRDC domain-containing protein n=1 Tax=Penstemon davidsonii TaxID=160366 RepID=A0ABR0D6G8_9LAMI|nr:hypothetical protein RD792_007439 [Penstemon davidsonii]
MKNPNLGFLEFLPEYSNEMGGTYVRVENEEQLLKLVEVLSKESVFAVDTEHHSFRSFLGFTALIQISTIKEDYLVDTINLHDAMGLLQPVFANPEICKVFHGADNDVLWLQRDFHIYVVNLFDTGKHPKDNNALENSSTGDKFHFLLEAIRRSNSTCLQLFAKDIEVCSGELAASSMVTRCLNDQGNILSSHSDSKELVRRLCLWRDIMARLHDESLRFVLSENAIIALASTIPTTEREICNIISKADLDVESMTLGSLQSPSPVVSCHFEDILYLFQENITNLDNIFELFIQRHLGSSGICPLSAYNYALLSKTNLRLTYRPTSNCNGFTKQVTKRSSRENFVKKFSCKSQVYHNCKIYANDGRLLCYCDRRKLEWYLNRNLAKLVERDPSSIVLLFEPKGRPEAEGNDFYIQIDFDKTQNRTVSSLSIMTSEETGVSPSQLRTASMALLRHGPQIPSERHEALMQLLTSPYFEQIVIKYYGGREISDEDPERALLVGMSPHERKKFEKKKGFAFKHLTGRINLNEEKEHTIGYKETLSIQNASKDENVDS